MLKLFRDLKKHKLSIVLIVVSTFLLTISELFLPTLMADIVDKGIVTSDINYIIKIGCIMLGISAMSVIFAVISTYLSAKVGTQFSKDLRNKIFQKVENYSISEMEEIGTASLITRTTNDVTQIQNVLVMMLRLFVRTPMMAIGAIIMAVNKNASLSMIIVAVVVVMGITITIVANTTIPLFKSLQKKLDRVNLVLRERLNGIRVIRAFNKTSYEKQRFEEANRDLLDTSLKINRIMAVVMPIILVLFNLTSVAIMWFGAFKVDNNSMQVGDLMAFLQYVMQIMMSIMMLVMIFIMVPRASASATRINEVLAKNSTIKDPEKAISKFDTRGKLEFKNVSFRYKGAEDCALTNISFEANPGEVTAIIGGTGAGKSTLVNLVSRFYDVSDGQILIDNEDITDITQKNLRSKIGFVPQKNILFSGTITENICFGSENISMDEVKRVAEIAQASEFIDTMKDGYDSIISQGGTNISGGQKQRLSIARALAKKPEIYIFDDSFSALDFKTDAKLRGALKAETKDATILIVAQRVTTVKKANRIIVLDEGKMVGIGTHDELLKTNSVYKQIVSSQLSEEELS